MDKQIAAGEAKTRPQALLAAYRDWAVAHGYLPPEDPN